MLIDPVLLSTDIKDKLMRYATIIYEEKTKLIIEIVSHISEIFTIQMYSILLRQLLLPDVFSIGFKSLSTYNSI